MTPRTIAITGEKGHGKDTFADFLRDLGLTHETIRFADGLKEMLRAFYRVSGLSAETIERKIEVLERGAFCIRVVNPNKARNESSGHASESYIASLLVHIEVSNEGDLEQFAGKAAAVVAWFRAGLPWPTPSATPVLVF